MGNRTGLPEVPGRPGTVNVGLLHPGDPGKQVAQDRQRPVRDGQQICERTAHRAAGLRPDQPSLPPPSLAHQAGRDEPVGLSGHDLGTGANRFARLGEGVVPVRVEVEQRQQRPGNPRAQQREQPRRVIFHNGKNIYLYGK
jgi:hypothetical protein